MVKNLLTKEEIKQIRETHFLSRNGLSLLLGWEEDVIEKIENGVIQQNKAQDKILRSLKKYSNFMEYYEMNRTRLSTLDSTGAFYGFITMQDEFWS